MALIKRPPETIERRIRLDAPVSQLLNDYARFVNGTPDDVTNFALRKMLTRGPAYKRWKTSQAPVAGTKESRTITEQAKTS